MKLAPSKLGGSPKQMATLGGLLVVALIAYLVNRSPSTPSPASPQRSATVSDPTVPRMPAVAKRPQSRAAAKRGENFQPSLKPPDGMDVAKIDPTIKLDLLAKVRNVSMETGSRGSVFAFGKEPPPPPPPPGPKTTITPGSMPGANPPAPPDAKPAPPSTPTAPPIPLKFYGYSNTPRGGPKRAFFLDGEDINVVTENDVIKNRYKIVKIGVNSVVVEDMNFKSQQTLPLVEELAG
ncbi:MAG TPA: hypothetical protein VNX18_24310 [Bryobacteraceae bacterium]|nr:hypothetical protein [Bryobacteraceae bacterium]